MNMSLPDDACVQIVIVPNGTAPLSVPFAAVAPMALPAPTRKPSRRRDVVFLTVGAFLCAGVLNVVRMQPTSPRIIDPARAALAPSVTDQQSSATASRPSPARPDLAAAAPATDPAEAVRQMLAQRPTVTPPPGTPPAAPVGGGATAPSRNAFGMSD